MADPHSDADDRRLRDRLESLKGDLAARSPATPGDNAGGAGEKRDGFGNAVGYAMSAASELVAGVAIGAGIGWGLDRLFSTRPLFLIVFFLLGVAAGMWNLVRMSNKVTRDAEARGLGKEPAAPGNDED